MTDRSPMIRRLDLNQVTDAWNIVKALDSCWKNDGIAAIPTTGPYVIAGPGESATVKDRLLSHPSRDQRFDLVSWIETPQAFRSAISADIRVWTSRLGRVVRRAWPGPLVIRLPDPISPGIVPGVQVPDWDLAIQSLGEYGRSVTVAYCRECPFDIGGDQADPTSDHLGVDLILDAGPRTSEPTPTWLQMTLDEQTQQYDLSMLHLGAIDSARLVRLASQVIVFVCTGNTCRSPMAEALCRSMLADRLRCPVDELIDHGYWIASAGIAASAGSPANQMAIEVMAERGLDLRDHLSQPLTQEMLEYADCLITMTRSHEAAILANVSERVLSTSEVSELVRPLDPSGDIDDPFGADLSTYRNTAEQISRCLESLLDDLTQASGR